MKRRMLLAIAVAGALGSSISSAQTFLCGTPSDLSFKACTEVRADTYVAPSYAPSTVRAPSYVAPSSTSADVTYRESEAFSITPPMTVRSIQSPSDSAVSVTTHTYSGTWPNTEPRVSTYNYTYGPWIYFTPE